ncbi:hypothetical protein D3C86_1526730 [compost metagenome]
MSACPEIIMKVVSGFKARLCFRSSVPEIFGILISEITREKSSFSMYLKPSRPSSAISNWYSGNSSDKILCSTPDIAFSSSTIKIFCIGAKIQIFDFVMRNYYDCLL